MKLLIDMTGCDMRFSSVTVYAYRILQGLSDNGTGNISVLCNSNIYKDIKNDFPNFHVEVIQLSRSLSPLSVIKGYLQWKRIVKSIGFDVIYSPMPYPPFACILNRGKIVTTMLDLQGLRVYSGIKLMLNKMVFPFVLKRSHKIITISDFVRDDIIKTYPNVDASIIKTVYCSVSSFCPCENTSPMKEPYILYVSSFMRHKNVMTLLRAFNIIKDRINHKLVLIGRENDLWKHEAIPFIKENGLEDKIVAIHSSIDDDKLAQYYEYTDLFIHPSIMEGFGLTPIEAAIHQVPVITTKEASLYETTKGILNYYEPATDASKLAGKIMEVFQNKPGKDKLKEISETLIAAYDRRKLAQELYSEMEKL